MLHVYLDIVQKLMWPQHSVSSNFFEHTVATYYVGFMYSSLLDVTKLGTIIIIVYLRKFE